MCCDTCTDEPRHIPVRFRGCLSRASSAEIVQYLSPANRIYYLGFFNLFPLHNSSRRGTMLGGGSRVHDGYVRIGSSRVTRWQLLVVVFLGCYVLGTLWFFSRGELRFDGPGGARGRGGGQVGGLDELPGDGLSSGGGGGGGGGLGASGRDGVVQRELALLRSELKNAQAQVRRLTATAAAGGGGGGGGMGSAVALVPLATETDPDSLQEEKEEREALMDEIDEEAEQFGTCVGVLARRARHPQHAAEESSRRA